MTQTDEFYAEYVKDLGEEWGDATLYRLVRRSNDVPTQEHFIIDVVLDTAYVYHGVDPDGLVSTFASAVTHAFPGISHGLVLKRMGLTR